MKSFYLLIIFSSLVFFSLRAGEVDPFFSLNQEIADSKEILNGYLNASIKDILERHHEEKSQGESCENVSLHVMEKLGADDYYVTKVGALNSDFELWVNANAKVERSPKYGFSEEKYVQESIYAPKLKFFGVWHKELDATINIGGVYVGIDKLSHFLGSGYEYFKIYLQAKQEGCSEYTAQLKAIEWGLKMENGILGRWPVGVFSYADLEANYGGFLLAKELCQNAMLSNINGKWELKVALKMQKYVNPNWDELYNANAYSKDREEEIYTNLDKLSIYKNINPNKYSQRFFSYRSLAQPTFSSRVLDVCSVSDEVNAQTQFERLLQITPFECTYKEFKEHFIEICQENKARHFFAEIEGDYLLKYSVSNLNKENKE